MTDTKALVPVGQRVENALVERRETLAAIFQGDDRKVSRFIKTAAVAIAKNPDLQRCTFESLVVACVEAAEVGIEPTGSLSRGWLVPFREKDGPTKAQFVLGWMGMADLAKQSGEVIKINARVVYEGDDFTVEQGTVDRIVHVPRYLTEDPTKITHVYAVATLRAGGTDHEVMTTKQVEGVRAMSKARNAMAWTGSWPEMARKTVVRRLCKRLKLTPEAVTAIERDDEREFSFGEKAEPTARTSSLKDALRGTPPPEPIIEGEAVEVLHPEGEEAPASEEPAPEPSAPEVTITSTPQSTTLTVGPTKKVCGDLSPYGDGATCVLAPHRSDMRHRSKDKESW
jgi:recombination protein RecT